MTRRHVPYDQRFGQFEPFVPGPSTPTFTLDRQVADARREMGEAKWAELQREWQS